MAGEREPMRARKPRRSRADDCDMASRIRCALEERLAARHRPVGGVTLQRADRDRLVVLMIAHAGAFAKNLGRADARAHAAQRIRRKNIDRRALQIAIADLADEAWNIDRRRARLHARRVVAIVAAARRGGGSGGVEQRRDIGELAGKLFLRQAVRGYVAGLLHGHTRSFVEVRT